MNWAGSAVLASKLLMNSLDKNLHTWKIPFDASLQTLVPFCDSLFVIRGDKEGKADGEEKWQMLKLEWIKQQQNKYRQTLDKKTGDVWGPQCEGNGLVWVIIPFRRGADAEKRGSQRAAITGLWPSFVYIWRVCQRQQELEVLLLLTLVTTDQCFYLDYIDFKTKSQLHWFQLCTSAGISASSDPHQYSLLWT